MNIVIKIFFTVLITTTLGCREPVKLNPKVNSGDETYQYVMALPDKITVTHTPSQVSATKGGRSGYTYTWIYQTSVSSNIEGLEIIEFGSFGLIDDKWTLINYTGKPFLGNDFSEWYSCPNAKLISGISFSDPQNWTGSEELSESKSLWYFIGIDKNGKKYKGVGTVITLAKLKSN